MKKYILTLSALCLVLCGCYEDKKSTKRYPDEDRVSNAQIALEAIRSSKSGKLKNTDVKKAPAKEEVCANKLPSLPNPKPLMSEALNGERIKPVFGIETCATREGKKFDVPFFRAGNKEIYVRRNGNSISDRTESGANNISIFVNGKKYVSFNFWGSNKNGFGYPFKELPDAPYSIFFDEKNAVYTYSQPYLAENGERAVAKIGMRALEDGTIEISWDSGAAKNGINPWIIFTGHRDKKTSFGGKQFVQNSRAALLANKKSISSAQTGDIEFGAGSPTNTVKILFGDKNVKGGLTESLMLKKSGDVYGLIWRMAKYPEGSNAQKGKFRVDLGEVAVAKDTPPPVGNIDFWAYDATHVPQPAVKNILPNPSFEQGTRYWRVRPQGNWTPDYSKALVISDDAKFGKKSLMVQAGESFYSFPIALNPNKKYVLSFYAKNGAQKSRTINLNIQNAGKGGKYPGKWGFGDFQSKDSHFKIDGQWRRFSRVVQGDAAGIQLVLQGHSKAPFYVDAFQLEESASGKPTDFAVPPLEGILKTSQYPENSVSFGSPINAEFEIFGKPNTEGKVKISVKNIYYENLYEQIFDVKIGSDGTHKIKLAFDEKKFGEGIFSVRADYAVNGLKQYTDYFRFDVMRKLENKHPTKNIFGTGMFSGAHSDTDAAGRKFMQWGFGSTTWFRPAFRTNYKERLKKFLPVVQLYKKYRIANQLVGMERALTPELEKFGNYRKWRNITADMEKLIEESAYIMVSETPDEVLETFAFGNEEESVTAGRYDDYAKAQLAAYRGAKRAKPHVMVAPTHGTSGYSSSRGRDAIDGYLEAALKRGIRYDAVGVHPYGNYDYDPLWDFDENVTYLKSRLKHFGYPDNTPIYMSECGNMCDASIPPWGTSNYDAYKAGKATYDFGNQEIFQSLIYARMYIAALKFYPQLRGCNVWTYIPFIDFEFSPLLLCKTVNTLGNLYPDVEYLADIRPSANVRGYAFKLKDGTGIAPVWTTDLNVARSKRSGSIMRVKFGQPVRFFDINANERSAKIDENGICEIPLTAAPLSIKAPDAEKLAKSLREGEVEDTASDIQLTFRPMANGGVCAQLRNTTGRLQKGNAQVDSEKFAYALAPKQTVQIPLKSASKATEGLLDWVVNYTVSPEKGVKSQGSWNMKYFYVPQVSKSPDWGGIEKLPITNVAAREADKPERNKKVKAFYQLAWDCENLYLKISVKDDKFILLPENWNSVNSYKLLWKHDGAVNVYFDTAADARSKFVGQNDNAKASLLSKPSQGSYDTNDYVYHFAPSKDGKDGKASVWRWIEVDHQLADGVNMPTKREAAEKISAQFKRTPDGYEYYITFPQRYIEPILLKRGSTSGFGVCIHMHEKLPNKKTMQDCISNSTERGVHTDDNPQFWPLMILK